MVCNDFITCLTVFTNRMEFSIKFTIVSYAYGVPRHIIGTEKYSHSCSVFTSLVTFCAGTQQCSCGELFFLHLGVKPDSDSLQTSSLQCLQMQLSNWISSTGSRSLSLSMMEALF